MDSGNSAEAKATGGVANKPKWSQRGRVLRKAAIAAAAAAALMLSGQQVFDAGRRAERSVTNQVTTKATTDQATAKAVIPRQRAGVEEIDCDQTPMLQVASAETYRQDPRTGQIIQGSGWLIGLPEDPAFPEKPGHGEWPPFYVGGQLSDRSQHWGASATLEVFVGSKEGPWDAPDKPLTSRLRLDPPTDGSIRQQCWVVRGVSGVVSMVNIVADTDAEPDDLDYRYRRPSEFGRGAAWTHLDMNAGTGRVAINPFAAELDDVANRTRMQGQ